MTFTTILAKAEQDGKTITACKSTNKYSNVPYYEIFITENNDCLVQANNYYKTSRTGWKKLFNKLANTL